MVSSSNHLLIQHSLQFSIKRDDFIVEDIEFVSCVTEAWHQREFPCEYVVCLMSRQSYQHCKLVISSACLDVYHSDKCYNNRSIDPHKIMSQSCILYSFIRPTINLEVCSLTQMTYAPPQTCFRMASTASDRSLRHELFMNIFSRKLKYTMFSIQHSY